MVPIDRNRAKVDDELRTLTSGRRRRLLRFLRDSTAGRATIAELIDHLDGAPGSGDREGTRVLLVHVDLPILVECGLLEYDPADETVRYVTNERVERLLGELADD